MRSDCMPLRRTILAGTSLIALAATPIAQDQTTASPTENGAIVLDKIVIDGGSGGVIDADGYVARSSATGAKIDTPFVQTRSLFRPSPNSSLKIVIRRPCSTPLPIRPVHALAALASIRGSTPSPCVASTSRIPVSFVTICASPEQARRCSRLNPMAWKAFPFCAAHRQPFTVLPVPVVCST